MGRFVFSIPPSFVVPDVSLATTGLERAPGITSRATPQAGATLQWEAADGSATGAPLRLPGAVTLEFPHSDGRMAWTDAPTSPSFSDDPPEEAVALRLSVPGRASIRIPRAALTTQEATFPQPQRQTFGLSDATLLVPVFSERFVDKDAFMSKVGELHQWTIAQAPFDREPTRSRIALVAHFWSSDPDFGLFSTPDDQSQDGRLFYGDREIAKQLLEPWIGGVPVSLILINSTKRGGAGGQRGYSAWTSITPAPGERWESVCLHEIGHGLGLADEYLDVQRAAEFPATLEPNVSTSRIPSQTPWGNLINVPDAPAPSFALDRQDHTSEGAIGTFEGARYRRDLYRPSLNCLMRDTRQAFCIVCQKHIEKVLSTPLIV